MMPKQQRQLRVTQTQQTAMTLGSATHWVAIAATMMIINNNDMLTKRKMKIKKGHKNHCNNDNSGMIDTMQKSRRAMIRADSLQ